MIAVLADDFTGAAEIGGVGLRHGLRVIIDTELDHPQDADLVVVATNTRSMTEVEAAREVARVIPKLKKLNPQYIFKKLDSVLRGNIVAEAIVQAEVMNKKRIIIVAGNPAFGRLIIGGNYFVNDVPLHKTFFANDPDFPVKSSSLNGILGLHAVDVYTSLGPDDRIPEAGIIFGDVANEADMEKWVLKLNDETIPAGGAGFFDAILNLQIPEVENFVKDYKVGDHSLFVFGSAFPKSEAIMTELISNGLVFSFMPREVYMNNCFDYDSIENWADEVVHLITNKVKVAVAVNFNDLTGSELAFRIQKNIAILIEFVMAKTELQDLLIEGGATAYEIINRLKIKSLYPFREIKPGVIQMLTDKYNGFCITTKPGSYDWPPDIFF